MKVYIAAPYVHAPVAELLAKGLAHEGHEVTSRWHRPKNVQSVEAELQLTQENAKHILDENNDDLYAAEVVCALGFVGGAETYVEVGRARERGTPVIWADLGGKVPLSARAEGVIVNRPVYAPKFPSEVLFRMVIAVGQIQENYRSTSQT